MLFFKILQLKVYMSRISFFNILLLTFTLCYATKSNTTLSLKGPSITENLVFTIPNIKVVAKVIDQEEKRRNQEKKKKKMATMVD